MCHCSAILACFGNLTYIFEKLSACCAAVAVVSCLVSTLIFMLCVGIGLGYNYCYVDYTSGRGIEDEINSATTIDVNSIVKVTRRNTKNAKVSKAIGRMGLQPTMSIPLKDNIDFPLLIKRIKESKQNITLQLTL